MPIQTLTDFGSSYYLVAFDGDGRERADDPDGVDGSMSARVLDEATRLAPTDVFLLAHGWKGDVPGAVEQYDLWISAMLHLRADRDELEQRPGGFRPVWVGLHWPSQPWGDEDLGGAEAPPYRRNAVAQVFRPALHQFVDEWAERLGDSPEIRAALEVIGREAAVARFRPHLSLSLRDAYRALDEALGLGADGLAAPPGGDREPFDPDVALAAEAEFDGRGVREGADILGPLRQLSFWTMKKRARVVGEGGMHEFVRALQDALTGHGLRVHLMGHSFGAIIASAIVGGPGGSSGLPGPVHSLVLVQGAMSLWSFARQIPIAPEKSGYFHRVVESACVAGPIVTTRSRHDTALGRFYPIAAGVARDMTVGVDEYPRYGALGAFGARGLDARVVDQRMLGVEGSYAFQPGTVHNLEASEIIRDGGGLSGAHSDVFEPEVAHAMLQASHLRRW